MIAGYTIANDLSVRDWQLRSPTMTLGKSFDTHGPLGPWVVTTDELGDPHSLSLKTWVNDELRQDGNTGEMIFDCFQQVAHLSEAYTVRIEVEGIGSLENAVVEEPDGFVVGEGEEEPAWAV